ncbi:MAG: hypothetical protein C0600_13700 [Ignavibacteria bacterium]|nr:MAG: hypothetical protein C0600_13700 [Ignavibacteria bacterium]
MFRLFFFSLFVVIPGVLAAQNAALRGVVTDGADQPLPGVHVLLPALDRAATTDNDGAFFFEGLPARSVLLRSSHLGYAMNEQRVELTPGVTRQLRIHLREAVIDLGMVSITGTRGADLLRNTPQPVSVIGAEHLLRRVTVSVPDALAAEPGIALVRDGMWGTDVSIRGLSRSNVVTLVDGARIETATAHAAGLSMIDLTDVDRIEVIRGPASSLYGSGATGGVVNIVTRAGGYTDGLYFGGALSSSYASVNRGSAGALTLDMADRWWYAHAHGMLRSAVDAETPNGTLSDSRFHDRNMSFSAGLRPYRSHEVRLRYQRFHAQDVGIPGGSSFPASASARYPDEDRELITAEYATGPLGTHVSNLTLRYLRQSIGRNVEIVPNDKVTLRPSADHEMDALQLQNTWLFGGHRIIAGADAWARRYSGIRLRELHASSTTIADLPLPDASFRSIGAFLQDEWTLLDGRMRLSLGGRVDQIHVENEEGYDLVYIDSDGQRNDSPPGRALRWTAEESDEISWSMHAGALYHLTDALSLTLNASRAFRAPSLEERYQYIELGDALWLGDEDLAAERGSMFDFGMRLHGSRVSIRANTFLRLMSDLVVDERMSDTLYMKTNIGEARLYGAELTGEYSPFDAAVLYATASFVRGQDTKNDIDLPQMPPLSVRLGFRMPIGEFLYADVSLDAAADQDAVAAGEDRTPGYALYSLHMRSTQLRFAGVGIQFFAGVENMFDRPWRRHLSTLRGLLRDEPGRNFTVRLRMLW